MEMHGATAGTDAGPIGLALSGGGFRATAFHLGVLKRLRELGLLDRIQVISGVSGGSIAAANWVFWKSLPGDKISPEEKWDSFERSLLKAMSIGMRHLITLTFFWLPAATAALLGAAGLAIWSRFTIGHTAVLVIPVFAFAYLCWHYGAPLGLEKCYEQLLFDKATLKDLNPADREEPCPILMVNATSLNYGHHLVFSTLPPDMSYAGLFPAIALRTQARYALRRGRPSLPMPVETTLAKAVAASSAIPAVFAPLRFRSVTNNVVGFVRTALWGKSGLTGNFDVVDGGVLDNQGTSLLGTMCHHLIVSDGAAALRETQHPSSWQVWPPGSGVIFRAQDIIYERVRELGYQRLEDRQSLFEILQECGVNQDKLDKIEKEQGPFLRSYSYVELMPSENFAWQHGKQRLPERLLPLVATIRTDLDRFSVTEISALMFHGYTSIDHCLHAYESNLLPENPPPLKFTIPGHGLFADWDHPSEEEIERAVVHLSASGSRIATWRKVCRWVQRPARVKSNP